MPLTVLRETDIDDRGESAAMSEDAAGADRR